VRDLRRCPGSGKTCEPVDKCPQCGATFCLGRLEEGGTLPDHATRAEPSARYYPRTRDVMENGLLQGAAMSEMREEQVIELLADANRDLTARLMRALEMAPPPVAIIRNVPGAASLVYAPEVLDLADDADSAAFLARVDRAKFKRFCQGDK